MGVRLCCCCKRDKQRKRKIGLLLVGLDNAGKSVAVKGLAGDSEKDATPPTVGLSVVRLKHADCTVTVFDLGGGPGIRAIWRRYFVDAHGIVFVVDASDYARLPESRDTLVALLSHEKIAGKPMLVLANKQDREGALDDLDLVEALRLERLVNEARCPTLVETCSAATGGGKSRDNSGLRRGYDWLLRAILGDYERLNERVERDVREQRERERAARLEKVARLRKSHEAATKRDDEYDAIESYSDYDRKLNAAVEATESRPLSVARLVKEMSRRGRSASAGRRRSNRTAPIGLLDIVARPRTAGDVAKSTPEELFHVNNDFQALRKTRMATNNKLPPLSPPGGRWANRSGISLIEIE